jgi:nicotinamide riboside kinase
VKNWHYILTPYGLLGNGKQYKQEDLLTIAKGQIREEEETIKKLHSLASEEARLNEDSYATDRKRLLFVDTDMHVIRIWSEYVFNACDRFILDHIAGNRYDHYLLCEPDVEWVNDDLREHPDSSIRMKLYHHYKDAMVQHGYEWTNISGNYEERERIAIEAIRKLLQ